MASSLFILRASQSSRTTSLQVFIGLPLGLGPSTSYSVHFFTQSSSSFHSTCPYKRSLFCCNTNAMSSIPSLSLNSLLGSLSFSLTPHLNLPYPTTSKSLLSSNAFWAKSFSHAMSSIPSLSLNSLLGSLSFSLTPHLNLPYPTTSKSLLSSNAFWAKSFSQTLSNRQKLNILVPLEAYKVQALPNLAW